jgi:hypothetical protein
MPGSASRDNGLYQEALVGQDSILPLRLFTAEIAESAEKNL